MLEEVSQLLSLGPTAVVAVVAIWALVEVVKLKKENNNNSKKNSDLFKSIKALEQNHLDTLEFIVREIRENQREFDKKLERIINLLIEIKEKK